MSNKILRTITITSKRLTQAVSIYNNNTALHTTVLHNEAAYKHHTQSHIQHARMNTTTSTSTATVKEPHYILSFYVPIDSTLKVCTEVCQKSGAGSYPGGLYTEAYWITRGMGQFRATEKSNPTIGTAGGEIEKVEEDKVEILCVGRDCVEKAVRELLVAHPYEQAPYYVVKVEEF